jgi:aspartate/methionine/tyrosine aminotransferase
MNHADADQPPHGRAGVEASPDQIILTDSGTQALDLVCRFLLQPGDTVLLDDPCFSISWPCCARIACGWSARR